MKNYKSKKDITSLNKLADSLKENNRKIALSLMELYFHYFGTPITQENGINLPMYDLSTIDEEDKILKDIKSICSVDVYVLTKWGIDTVHYTKGNKNEWTAHGPTPFLDRPLNLKYCFEKKYITDSDCKKLDHALLKVLLGSLDLSFYQEDYKKEAEKKAEQNAEIDAMVEKLYQSNTFNK